LELARDREIHAVILQGEGGVFCSGADLKYIRAGGEEADLGYLEPRITRPDRPGYGPIFKQILEYIHSTLSEIRRAPKPFIAVVEGPVAAGGLGIALCCDLVLASEDATFEWAYFRTGLTGAEGSTFFLPRLVGLRRAMDIALLGPRLSASQALEYGLISRVCPASKLALHAFSLAHELASGPTGAYAAAKALLNQSAGMDGFDAHLDRELDALSRIADGDDFAEGLEAFFEKRAPRFRGDRAPERAPAADPSSDPSLASTQRKPRHA
ncbi:MAG: enoyl-CoA hydratase-related protein, partial [Myxococcales bacterium]|nr:enoyl-CoA hydratase-related protein [Myxococcales bacterium]